MFEAIFRTQWKATRVMVLLTTLMAFALPLASITAARDGRNTQSFVGIMQSWGGYYSVLAALAGLLVALAAWRPDHLGRHVYALSLPIARPRYTMFRFSAGAAFLAPTIAGVLLGALVVTFSGAVPEGLHAYPVALSLRFGLAALVSYALFFAISSSTSRTAGIIIAVLVGLAFAQYLLSVVADSRTDILTPVLDFILYRPGILSVFAGRWMLIDA
ncbi:MAG TPA: hypothetical protein VF483_13090 [Gemmatimonadaceae bacterium]